MAWRQNQYPVVLRKVVGGNWHGQAVADQDSLESVPAEDRQLAYHDDPSSTRPKRHLQLRRRELLGWEVYPLGGCDVGRRLLMRALTTPAFVRRGGVVEEERHHLYTEVRPATGQAGIYVLLRRVCPVSLVLPITSILHHLSKPPNA